MSETSIPVPLPPAPLIHRAIAGDESALCPLLEQHAPELRRRLAHAIPRRWRRALTLDDVLQETFLDAFLRITELEPRGDQAFVGWLMTLARHNLVDAVRSLEAEKRGGGRRPLTLTPEGSAIELLERLLPGHSSTPSRTAIREEDGAALLRALADLPEDHARVVQMYDLEGLPISEVASALKRSPGAAHMLRSRAHRHLRRLLSESR